MKVVINACFGGFSISEEAQKRCAELGFVTGEFIDEPELRSHPVLIQVVEELRSRANGSNAQLKVIEIPFDSVEGWYIDEYDGKELISEKHETWQ